MIKYKITGNTLYISGGNGEIRNYKSISVAPWMQDLKSKPELSSFSVIKIEEGITQIGDYAFANCYNVRSVILPKSLKIIGKHAFSNCSGIRRIDVYNNLEIIKSKAFYNCFDLMKFQIHKSDEISNNENSLFIESDAFESSSIIEIRIPNTYSLDTYNNKYKRLFVIE